MHVIFHIKYFCCFYNGEFFMTDHLKQMQKSDFFRHVSKEDFNMIVSSLDSQLKYYRPMQTVMPAGRKMRRIALVLEGTIEIYQQNYWGDKAKMYTIESGQIFAEAYACDPGAITNVSAVAGSDTTILWFDVMDILRIDASDAGRTQLIRNIMNSLANKNMRLNSLLWHTYKKSTKDKLLAYLSDEAIKAGSSSFTIEFDRQQLADYLGVERSAMSAQISKLVKEGYFRTNRSYFELLKK